MKLARSSTTNEKRQNTPLAALLPTVRRLARVVGYNPTPYRWLEVVRSDAPTAPEFAVARPAVCVILQGRKQVTLGKRVHRYDPEHFLVTSGAVPIVGQVTEATKTTPYLCLVLTLDPAAIYDVVRIVGDGAFNDARGGARRDRTPAGGVYVERLGAPLLEAVARLVAAAVDDDDRAVIADLTMREVVFRLLSSPHAGQVRESAIAGSNLQRIGAAIARLQADLSMRVAVADLARLSGMGVASFHDHFKRATSLTPLQFHKELRLQHARKLLFAGTRDAATAAFDVGYESPSQFSREYARRFGLSPTADRQRFRDGAHGIEVSKRR